MSPSPFPEVDGDLAECWDCEEDVPHLQQCPRCELWVCDWCWGHIHGAPDWPDPHAAPAASGRGDSDAKS